MSQGVGGWALSASTGGQSNLPYPVLSHTHSHTNERAHTHAAREGGQGVGGLGDSRGAPHAMVPCGTTHTRPRAHTQAPPRIDMVVVKDSRSASEDTPRSSK